MTIADSMSNVDTIAIADSEPIAENRGIDCRASVTGAAATSDALPSFKIRKRLWKIGGLLALFLLTAIVCNFFLSPDKAVSRRMLGHDFLAFYAGGTFARTGHFEKLYDLDAARKLEESTGRAAGLDMGKSFGPWWNPPFAAWMFAPLTALPYEQALTVWWIISFAALAGACAIMAGMLPRGTDWRTWGLIPLLLLTAMPCFQALNHGQNTCVSLLLLSSAVALWRTRHTFLAGVVCGLLAYKPQLGALVGLVLIFNAGMPAIGGLAATGMALLLTTILTMPDALGDYLHKLPAILHHMQVEQPYLWERHVTLKSFWRLLLQGKAAGEMALLPAALCLICQLTVAAALAAAAFATGRRPWSQSNVDRLIAATIASMPLLMPFYFDYDLTLLAIAATLCAADAINTGMSRSVLLGWCALYIVTECSTAIAGATYFCPAVPTLMALSGILAWRAIDGAKQPQIKQKTRDGEIGQRQKTPMSLAA
jgi:hypothetical protein